MKGIFSRGQAATAPGAQAAEPTADATAPELTVYSTSWCGYCHRLMKQLDRAGVPYTSVDIERNPEATQYVMQVNGGDQTVPTVGFDDGTALTDPSLKDVLARVGA